MNDILKKLGIEAFNAGVYAGVEWLDTWCAGARTAVDQSDDVNEVIASVTSSIRC